jgi:hypothetical protein
MCCPYFKHLFNFYFTFRLLLKEGNRMRRMLIVFWTFIDPIYYFLTRLTYVNKERNNIFRVRKTNYLGYDVELSDGTRIQRNDLLIKIHLHNVRLLRNMKKIKNDFKKGTYIYRNIKYSLPELASYIYHHPDFDRIKGIIGITTLHRGCEKLGFEPKPLKNPLYKKLKWAAFLPISYISSDRITWSDLSLQEPKYLFMSKEKLIELYLPEHKSRTSIVPQNALIHQKVYE